MKRIIVVLCSLLLMIALVGCQGKAESKEQSGNTNLLTGKQYIEIDIEGYGVIEATLDADVAPITVTHFMQLVDEGCYTGSTFHRIMDGFMMQGGIPGPNAGINSEVRIKGEFANNGVANPISHVRGTVSLARAQDKNSGSSQFFIVQSDSTFLDGDYAGFGVVTSGMEIVDQICATAPVTDNNGTVPAQFQPVIKSITNVTAQHEGQ